MKQDPEKRLAASLAIAGAALLVAACGSEVLVFGSQPGDETPHGQPPNGGSPDGGSSHVGGGDTSTKPGQGASGLGGVAGGPSTNCSGGLQACGDSCVDLLSDEAHCGGCFQPCEAQAGCVGGSCTCASPVCGACDIGMLPPDLPASVQGTATSDHVEPSCADPGSPDALYRFTAPQDAHYVFDTVGSSYDTVLLLVDEQCGQGACNDDYLGVTSQLTTSLAAGEQVLLVVDGHGGDSGHFVLNASLGGALISCPQLDLGSSAPQTITGSTLGQPAGYDESCGGWDQPEVSHRFQAPEAGDYIFHTDGSSFDTVLYVRDGDCDGPTLACNDDGIGANAIVLVTMQQQQEVIVFVDGYSESGAYQLTVAGPL